MNNKIILALALSLILSGCSAENVTDQAPPAKETPTMETGDKANTEVDGETEDKAAKKPDEPESTDDEVTMEVRYWYDVEKIMPTSLYIQTSCKDKGIFIKSGDLSSDNVKGSKNFNMTASPQIGSKDDDYVLTQDNINDIRKSYIDLYNNSLGPIQDRINDLFTECTKIYPETPDKEDYLTDFSDAPGELTMVIEDSPIKMQVSGCKVYVCGSMAAKPGQDDHPLKHHSEVDTYLTAISLSFLCKSEDMSVLSDYISKIKEENMSLAERPASDSIIISDVLTFEPSVTAVAQESSDEEKSEDDEASDDTGIVGKWYEYRDDAPDYYIQINADGTGETHSYDVFKFTYTFVDNVLAIKIRDYDPAYYYYEDGKLYSDADGGVYAKKKKPKQPEPTGPIDITGKWIDPTGLSVGGFVFNGDGTGTWIWDVHTGRSQPMTYSTSGNTIHIQLTRTSSDIYYHGTYLFDGVSQYVRR